MSYKGKSENSSHPFLGLLGLVDFLHVIGEVVGEIRKRSCSTFKYRSDKQTVDNNNIIWMDYTVPKISQGVKPSVGFLDNIIAVNNPW